MQAERDGGPLAALYRAVHLPTRPVPLEGGVIEKAELAAVHVAEGGVDFPKHLDLSGAVPARGGESVDYAFVEESARGPFAAVSRPFEGHVPFGEDSPDLLLPA